MAALHHPFAAENLAALAIRITRADFEPLSSAVGMRQAAAGSGAAPTTNAAGKGPCYSPELLTLPSRLLQVDPALRPDAASLLMEPLVLSHGSSFGASVGRCAASASVLRDASKDPAAFGIAFGLPSALDASQGSGAPPKDGEAAGGEADPLRTIRTSAVIPVEL